MRTSTSGVEMHRSTRDFPRLLAGSGWGPTAYPGSGAVDGAPYATSVVLSD